jgi:hypothetical protein
MSNLQRDGLYHQRTGTPPGVSNYRCFILGTYATSFIQNLCSRSWRSLLRSFPCIDISKPKRSLIGSFFLSLTNADEITKVDYGAGLFLKAGSESGFVLK